MDNDRKTGLDIVLIEDSRLLREMLGDVLASIRNIAVVAEAADEHAGLQHIEHRRPDLVIVDLELTGGSGIGVLSALQREPNRYGTPKAVVFTNHVSTILRRRCEALGIDGFFDKSYQLDKLIDYVQAERDSRTH